MIPIKRIGGEESLGRMADPSPRTPKTDGEVLGVVTLETLRRSSQNVLIEIRN